MWETLLWSKYSQIAAAKYMKGRPNILVRSPGQHLRTGACIGQGAKSVALPLWCASIPSSLCQPGLQILASSHTACLQAFDCVPEDAVTAAADVLMYMLRDTPASICQQLAANDADVAIIGRNQVVSDMPPHGHLRGQSCAVGDRTFDHGTRGVGGNLACPTCSVGIHLLTRILHSAGVDVVLTVSAAARMCVDAAVPHPSDPPVKLQERRMLPC